MKMMDCLFRSLALATARKAKKRIMMVVKRCTRTLARQLCRIRTGGAGVPQDWFALLGCRRHKGCLGWWWALRVECGGGDYLPEINPMPGLNPVPMPGLNPNA